LPTSALPCRGGSSVLPLNIQPVFEGISTRTLLPGRGRRPMTCRNRTFPSISASRVLLPFCLLEIQHAKLTGGIQYGVPTHVLGFDLRFTLAKAALDIFILPAFVGSETLDQVIKGFFEPKPSRLTRQSVATVIFAGGEVVGLKYTHIVSACHRLTMPSNSKMSRSPFKQFINHAA
jgi:hypothetical protein